MNTRDPGWLRDRLRAVLGFYYPACVDEERGGHVAQLDPETGEVYDADARHLVATCRFVANFSLGARLGVADWCAGAAEHGLRFLREAHRQPDGGYAWLLDGTEAVDDHRSPYGHAFVLLAVARAVEAGLADPARVDEVAALVDDRFAEPNGLLRSDLDADWKPREPYRGQNANMHACEAFLAAHEATTAEAYLERALTIARRVAVDLADEEGRIWEHYTADWEPDYDYNRAEPTHQFRPWGYQPGHHAEWAKLLVGLARHRDQPWLLTRARDLFEHALDGWDGDRGGFCYTLDPEGDPVVADKYGWPVAEAIGGAAALAERTGRDRYWADHERFWTYAREHLEAPGGDWYEKCTPENEPVDHGEGPAVEPGYHPVGACYESLRALDAV